MKLNVVLVEPEIPQNTGNIARTCAATGCVLHLVRPLGFEVDDKYLKRAGLDYWDKLEIFYYENFEEFLKLHKEDNLYMLTTKGKKVYSDICFKENDYILFGKETKGLPEKVLLEHFDHAIRIPMRKDIRSLNLANSVNIVVYEAFRQNQFVGLEEESMYFDS